jgi:predicted transcriptional regulator
VTIDLFKSLSDNICVKPGSIRTSIDLPRDIHRRLHELAARKGCSARQLILASIAHAIEDSEPTRPARHLNLDPSLIPAAGRHIDLTNEQIYELIEFP